MPTCIVVALAIVALDLPALGANQTPQSLWTPVNNAASWQSISFAPEGWPTAGNTTASCDATRYRAAGALMLVVSGTPCADTRSLVLTFQDGRANLFAMISATETTSLSTNFDLTLKYRLTDTLSLGVQEIQGGEASLLGALREVPTAAPTATWLFGPVAGTADASLTRISLDYNSGPWSAHAAVASTSLFTLQEVEIRNAITPAWAVDLGISRTVAGFATLDAISLTVNGRLGDVSVGLSYARLTTATVPESDDLLVLQTSVDVPSLSVTLSGWGWLWTLSGTGSANRNLTLTAQRFDPNIAVTVSGDPFGVSLASDIEF